MYFDQIGSYLKDKNEQIVHSYALPFLQQQEVLDNITSLFSDEESRENYTKEIAFLISRNISTAFSYENVTPLPLHVYRELEKAAEKVKSQPDFPKLYYPEADQRIADEEIVTTFTREQYRYKDIVKVEKDDVFIDCGACFGDTAVWAYMNGAKRVVCFEAKPSNIAYLKRTLVSNGYPADDIFMLAVSNKKGTIPFCFNDNCSNGLIVDVPIEQIKDTDNNPIINVDCVKLDDVLSENNIVPTYIKMDIEGAEPGALEGCAETIKRYKPKLAICLYHNPSDMWTIPTLIHSLVPEYKFYCQKSHCSHEFLLYATI